MILTIWAGNGFDPLTTKAEAATAGTVKVGLTLPGTLAPELTEETPVVTAIVNGVQVSPKIDPLPREGRYVFVPPLGAPEVGSDVLVGGAAWTSTGVSQGALLPAMIGGFVLVLMGIGLIFTGRYNRATLVVVGARSRFRPKVDNSEDAAPAANNSEAATDTYALAHAQSAPAAVDWTEPPR